MRALIGDAGGHLILVTTCDHPPPGDIYTVSWSQVLGVGWGRAKAPPTDDVCWSGCSEEAEEDYLREEGPGHGGVLGLGAGARGARL